MKKFKKSLISDIRLGIVLTLVALFAFFWGASGKAGIRPILI